MDLGFIRGPDSNLPNIITNGAAKGKHVIQGRQGKTCYLLIIDAAIRQLWRTFLLKNKNSPESLIDSFFRKNDIGGKRVKITTSPNGIELVPTNI